MNLRVREKLGRRDRRGTLRLATPPPATPQEATIELISACRRPANDLIKILKTMISVATEKLPPSRSMAQKEATVGELIAERDGEAQERRSGCS
jgi:hypothetical protein